MLGDIDLIYGIWVYNDELQIKFTFHSGPMIFGWVMALGLWNLVKYLVVTTLFTMIWDIDLIFGMRVYDHKLQINWNSFVILSLILRELKKGEAFAKLLNIHGGDIRVVPTHLVFYTWSMYFLKHLIRNNLFVDHNLYTYNLVEV